MIRALLAAAPSVLAATSLALPAHPGPVVPASPLATPTGLAAPESPPAVDFEAVLLDTHDDFRLRGSFYAPRGSGRRPGLVLVHDAGGTRADVAHLASYLQRRGFGVLTLDLRGHGESATDEVAWSGLDEEGRRRLWAYAMRDIAAGVGYLRVRPEIHTANLTMVGVGAASTLAARYAVRDENVRAVVLVQPGEEQFGFDLAGDVVELEGLPILIVSERDRRTCADRLREEGHRGSRGREYVDVEVLKEDGRTVLDNKRLPNTLQKWLGNRVVDRKGS